LQLLSDSLLYLRHVSNTASSWRGVTLLQQTKMASQKLAETRLKWAIVLCDRRNGQTII
jgi:hypothetical protein